MRMSRDNATTLYRWVIGGLIAAITYFAIKIDNKVEKMYDHYIQQHHVDKDQDNRLNRLELDVNELRRAQTYVSTNRSSTLVN